MNYKDDAEKWGGALNEAGWVFLEEYRKVMGEEASAKFFNSCKTMLRPAILAYIERVEQG